MLETYFVGTGGFYVGEMISKNVERLRYKMKRGDGKNVSNGGGGGVARSSGEA